jgi:hypothetical protein
MKSKWLYGKINCTITKSKGIIGMYKIIKMIHLCAGVIGSILIFIMAVTGILLNHRSLIGYSSDVEIQLQDFLYGLHTGIVDDVSFIWLTDLGAICMIILSITGIWLWIKQLLSKKRAKK